MKRNIVLIFCLFLPYLVFAQVKKPVKWTFAVKKTHPTEYEFEATALVDKGWHIYSTTTPKGGPIPTEFSFNTSSIVALDGGIKEVGKMEKIKEPLFGVDVYQYSEKVSFVQKVKLKAAVKTNLSGSVEFMVCSNKECLPPVKQAFEVGLK